MARGTYIVDRDRGFRALMKRVDQAARGKTVTVGVHAEEGGAEHEESDGLTVADVASIHEFGLGSHPERSFIRAWVGQDRDELEDIERKMAESVVKGTNTAQSAIERMGVLLEAKSRGFIQDGRVAPPTVKTDEGNTTLIDTSQLVTSITHKVE